MGCQHHVRQLAAEQDSLEASIIAVGPGTAAAARALAAKLAVPFPLLADPAGQQLDRLGFSAFGPMRQSGVVVTDGGGTVVLHHHGYSVPRALPLARVRAALAAPQP